MQEGIQHKHTEADDIASAKADEAFNDGKWEKFTGSPLRPTEPVIDTRDDEPTGGIGYPAFYEKTEDRTPLNAEQLKASASAFNELFDDLMLKGMEHTKRHEIAEGRPTLNLLRRIEVDGQTYSLSVQERGRRDHKANGQGTNFRDSEIYTRLINLQRIDQGYGREAWSYRLGADGVVRLWDGGDATAKRQNEEELGIERSESLTNGATPDFDKLAKKIAEGLLNDRLEEDMGINHQPVSPEHLRGLQDFLSKAVYIPSR